MPCYKLHYFDMRGAGETARLMFAFAGVQYENIEYAHKEWGPELKMKMPFGQVPVLEVDGQLIPQSGAIYRYLGKQFGLLGKTDFEAAWVDALFDQFKDYVTEFVPFFYIAIGHKEGDKEKSRKEVGEPARDKFFPLLATQLRKAGTGFLVGDSPTFIDFFLAEHVLNLQKHIPGFLDGFPEVLEHQKKIHSLPEIKDYVTTRRESPY